MKIKRCLLQHRKKFKTEGMVILFLIFLILFLQCLLAGWKQKVLDQNVSLRWGDDSYAQVSCFTSRKDSFTTDEILKFEYDMNQSLNEFGTADSDDEEDDLLWMDGYCGTGTMTVMNGNTKVEGTVYGVGNSFFSFHPLDLLSGGYIDNNNVMKDYIMLDEESAWQLFGSSEVEGLTVQINGELFVVAGVFRRPDNYFNNATQNNKISYYVSWEALQKIDEDAKITTYEVVMKNPVHHYARDFIANYFTKANDVFETDTSEAHISDREITVIENSERYSFLALTSQLKDFALYSMVLEEIAYPFWENIARAYGVVFAGITLMQIIFVMVLLVTVCVVLFQLRKYTKNTKKGIDILKNV